MSAGRRGGTVICKCQKGRAASRIRLGAGLEKGEREWWGVGGSGLLCSYPIPIRDAAPCNYSRNPRVASVTSLFYG